MPRIVVVVVGEVVVVAEQAENWQRLVVAVQKLAMVVDCDRLDRLVAVD